MNVDETMRRFADRGEFPREALQWALNNRDAGSPRGSIAKLRAYGGGASQADANLDVLFFVIHLCGEKCDSRAYVPLCDLIASDETIDVWFGETTTGTLRPSSSTPRWRCRASEARDRSPRGRRVRPRRGDGGARLPRPRQRRPRRRGNVGLPLASRQGDAAPRGKSGLAGLGVRSRPARLRAVARRGRARLLEEMDRPCRGIARRILRGFTTGGNDPLGMAAISAVGIEPYGSCIELLNRWCDGEDDEWEGAEDDVELTSTQTRLSPRTCRSGTERRTSIPFATSAATTRVRAAAARNTRSAALPREPLARSRVLL